MNITEFMSFDLEWFKTLPGILITGGVILLLIALIIFIISNKKSEKNATNDVATNTTAQEVPVVNNDVQVPTSAQATVETVPIENSMPTNSVATMDFGANVNNTVAAEPINNVVVNNTSEIPVTAMPVNNVQNITNDVNSIQTPVVQEPIVVEPVNNIEPVVANNVIDFSVPATNAAVVEPVQNTVVVPTVEQPTIPVTEFTSNAPKIEQVATPTPMQEEKPMIYGGVNPVNTIAANTGNVKPVIYGGADPLENTTTIPRMNNNGAYNVGYTVNTVPSESVVEPVVTQEPVTNAVQAPSVDIPQPVATPTMPMTGAEMFGTSDIDNGNTTSSSSSEIETLEF